MTDPSTCGFKLYPKRESWNGGGDEGRGAEGLRELMAGGLPPGLGWGLQWCQEEGAGYGVGSWLLPLGLGTLGTGEGGPSCPLRGLGVVVLEAET